MNEKWLSVLKKDPIPWLLESNSRTKYGTLVDLLGKKADSTEVIKAKGELLGDPMIQLLVKSVTDWFPKSITRHNDPSICFYRMRMLSDFGLRAQDPGIEEIINKMKAHRENGLFAVRQTLPEKGPEFSKHDPDSGEWHSLPCDSPLITYILLKLGDKSNDTKQAAEEIRDRWNTQTGWFCHFFFVEGQYRKQKAGCPMAGLQALELFSMIPELKESIYARNACSPLYFHKESGKSLYYFGRSKKFLTVKYPFVWYNAFYLAEVLTRFDFLKDDILVKELIRWIENCQDENGRFKPGSMFKTYREWDFADKKNPSPWITFLCCRILKRWYGI